MRPFKFNIVYFLLILYLSLNIIFFSYLNTSIFNYIINPLSWFIIFICTYKNFSNKNRFNRLTDNIKTLLIATLFYLILNFLSGLILGYTKNPYSIHLLSLLSNFYQIILIIIFLEYTRSAIINKNVNNKFYIILFTIIFIMLEINYYTLFNNINNKELLFKYICSVLIPLIFSNILYTYLTIKGSYKLVLVYRILVEISFLILPIIPNLDWFMLGIRGIIAPTIIYLFLKFNNTNHLERTTIRKRKTKNPIIYIPLFTIIIIFVAFMIGLFIYEPIAILSNSMNPIFNRGDVVIYRKVTKEELENLKIYTIILYNKDGQAIVHRVIDRYVNKGTLYFITKGDANNTQDSIPVSESQVIGIYETSIKYIGYPSVWLNQFFKYEQPEVEIK